MDLILGGKSTESLERKGLIELQLIMKITLCIIIGLIMFLVGFFTIGLQPILCPAYPGITSLQLFGLDGRLIYHNGVKINGKLYEISSINETLIKSGHPSLALGEIIDLF